ncbi:hypothetical protein MXM59_03815 [Mammaliicoccus sciuri]|uniref:hypothetical protein n=1 Tax=Mammaliicoccus sciuri TaxID=1296 RepID=UPI002DBB4BA6|nr:hypothetical protein [Mammaliicoccus sciuri]MEB6226337.1 hypothetical protein [Mammaliicoccus sciuri]
MAEINIRYLQDTDGERYFPMTHVNAILGLEEFDNGDDISNLNALINKLNTDNSALQNRVSKLEMDSNQFKQEIEQMKQEIEALKSDSTLPLEEGE